MVKWTEIEFYNIIKCLRIENDANAELQYPRDPHVNGKQNVVRTDDPHPTEVYNRAR